MSLLADVLLAVFVVVVGAAVWAYFEYLQPWYCRNCGQFLGRGEKPRRCERCGSNRLSSSDPGVGKKIRTD